MNDKIRVLDKDGFEIATRELVNLIKNQKVNVEADFLTSSGFGNL